MRIVVALGGNALLRRGEPMSVRAQRENVRLAARGLAPIALEHELVVTHGNGPQVGLLALQAAAYEREEEGGGAGEAGEGASSGDATSPVEAASPLPPLEGRNGAVPLPAPGPGSATIPLDVLGAQSEGMIGYVIEQELGNVLPFEKALATILTMVEVDPEDPAFANPSKPIGPVYDEERARSLARERGWSIAPDGPGWRRVVASPTPLRVFEVRPIEWLLEQGAVVICAGGGGIPTAYGPDGALTGVEAVVDKDLASALLARQLEADLLVLATDVPGLYEGWGAPSPRLLGDVTPEELSGLDLPAGSMGSKVAAARGFTRETGKRAAIGSLEDLEKLVAGTAGTQLRA